MSVVGLLLAEVAEGAEVVQVPKGELTGMIVLMLILGLVIGSLAGYITGQERKLQRLPDLEALRVAHRLHFAAWETQRGLDEVAGEAEYEDERE